MPRRKPRKDDEREPYARAQISCRAGQPAADARDPQRSGVTIVVQPGREGSPGERGIESEAQVGVRPPQLILKERIREQKERCEQGCSLRYAAREKRDRRDREEAEFEVDQYGQAVATLTRGFGEAYEGEVLHQDVSITNNGDADFPISRIQTSCGCTVAKLFGPGGVELSTRPKGTAPIVVLKAGETIKTSVEFKTAGKHGAVSQKMTVHNTDHSVKPFEVPVHVQVNRALAVTPRWVNLGSISKADSVRRKDSSRRPSLA